MDKVNDYLSTILRLEKENQELQRKNARLEEKLNAALDSNGLCLWEQHVPSGELTIFNMQWGKMLGYQPGESSATVETWKNSLHPDDYNLAVGAFEDHLAGKTDLYEVVHRMQHKDGTDSWVYDRGRIVEYDDNGSPLRMMGTHIDITKEKRLELQLAKLASTDALTGLLNRSAITEVFDTQNNLNSSQKSALIFIDIDNFKGVNDELGHHAGDQVLIDIAQGLVNLESDYSHIARIGGDEFVILCADTDQTQIDRLCERILMSVIPAINLSLTNISIGASIGLCYYTQGEHHFEQVYQSADKAMYKVKKNGKNDAMIFDLNNTEAHA